MVGEILDFINSISRETLIICSDSDKKNILKRKKLINYKVMNIEQFMSKFCFEYDEFTIKYVMEHYNVKYDIALVYLKNLYYIIQLTVVQLTYEYILHYHLHQCHHQHHHK